LAKHVIGLVLAVMTVAQAGAEWKVVDARWRPDANPHTQKQVWDGWIWSEGWPEDEQFWPKYFEPAGSVHLILRNESDQADTILLTEINDIRPAEAVTTPQRATDVIWYRLHSPRLGPPQTGVNREDERWAKDDPVKVQPGGWAECTVRFRSVPKEAVRLRFKLRAASEMEVSVPVQSPGVRLESICFSPRIDRVLIYVRSLDGRKVKRGTVHLDGKAVESRWIEGPKPGDLALAEAKLDPQWEYGSHHLVEVNLPDAKLAQPVRAWDGYFTLGMYGELTPEKIRDAKEHGVNTYFTAGVSPLLDEAGLNVVPAHNVGEGRMRTAEQSGVLFYQNKDEPDAHDFSLGSDLPLMERLGVHGQSKVLPFMRYQRVRDPRTPNLLLVDNTYKPLAWYVYGQIPDVYCTDPYVPLNGRQLDYVPHALEVARDACTPRPLVSVLWACGLKSPKKMGDRPPTAEEERIMAFYALGCGVKGLAYFIDLTTSTGEGEFLGLSDIQPLWAEVGRINRDAQALAPYLSIACPLGAPNETEDVWSRTLVCGPDALALIVVNRKHYIGFETKSTYAWHEPARNVDISVPLPKHLRSCLVREVKDGKLVPFAAEVGKDAVRLRLDSVDTARAFVIVKGETK
jgi:hypothetical protein